MKKNKKKIKKKILALSIIFILLLSYNPIFSSTIECLLPNDTIGLKISTISYEYTGTHFDVCVQETNPRGITWDGTYFWVIGWTMQTAYRYNAGGGYTGVSIDARAQDIFPTGITWDGTDFWITGADTDKVYKYNSAGVYQSVHFNVGSQDTTPQGITWDGTHFWVVGSTNDEVYKYNSDGVYTGVHFDTSAEDNSPCDITWDGTYFWVVGTDTDKVYKYTSAGVYTGTHFDVGAQDISPTGITWDGTYFWMVGTDTDKVYKYVQYLVIVPEAPILNDIIPNPDTDGNINLNWNYDENAEQYSIYRSKDEGSYELLGTTSLNDVYYIDIVLENGVYFYKIKAENIAGLSEFSNVESVIVNITIDDPDPDPVPDSPILNSLTYTIDEEEMEIQLSWSVVNCDSYNVYRSFDGGMYYIIQSNLNSTSYSEVLSDAGLYTYKVSAVNEYGESELSNSISITLIGDSGVIPDYIILILCIIFIVLGVLAILTIILIKRKNKKNNFN